MYHPSNSFYYPFPNQNDYIPVSSYSTLNGATSISSNPQPQVPIDPTLTDSSTQLQAAHNTSSYSNFPHSNSQLEPILSINPSALQNPPTPLSNQHTLTSSVSRATPKAPLRDVLKPLLTASKLTGPSAVGIIVKVLDSYGSQDIDCEDRTELFSKLSVQADDQFFKAWLENTSAMDITRNWLKAGASDKLDGPWRPSINPILSALGRMRFTIESLKNAKLGKIILKLTKDTNSATRDLSQDLEVKWRKLVDSAGSQGKPSEIADDSKLKKRKAPDGPVSKIIPPAKRAAVGIAPPAKPLARREPKVVVTSVQNAKSDSSFFSNKAKAKLPKFTKAAAPTSKTGSASVKETENISQPSSFDPFRDALRSMKRTASPKTEVRSETPQAEVKQIGNLSKLVTAKKKKSVTFAPDSQLEQIKYIEKAVYDDDLSIDTMHGMQSLRDLDRDEGAALHAHNIFEEQMDWVDILLVELPASDLEERGSRSAEKFAQDEREKSALGAVYMFPSQIPESPTEPHQQPPDDPDSECKLMIIGDEIDGLTNEQTVSSANLADLLASLPPQIPGLPFGTPSIPTTPTVNPQIMGSNDTALLSNFLQTMAQQGNIGAVMMQQALPTSMDNSGWDGQQLHSMPANGSNSMQWEISDTGWGAGRGRGGGFRGKRRPCNYFAQGRCRYGDNCDFSHDLTS